MSDNQWDNEDNQEQETGKGLRAQLEAALAAKAEAEAAASAAKTEAAGLKLEKSLTAAGVRPSLGKWILKDGVDPSDDGAVARWLADNKDEFNIGAPAQQEQPAVDEPAAEVAPEAQGFMDQQTALDAMRSAMSAGQGVVSDKLSVASRELAEDSSAEEVLAVFRKHGL